MPDRATKWLGRLSIAVVVLIALTAGLFIATNALHQQYRFTAEASPEFRFGPRVRPNYVLAYSGDFLPCLAEAYGRTSNDSGARAGLVALSLFMVLFALGPVALWLWVRSHFKAHSRATYAIRFSSWSICIFGLPLAAVMYDVIAGRVLSYIGDQLTTELLSAVQLGMVLVLVLGFLSFGFGSMIGGKRFPART